MNLDLQEAKTAGHFVHLFIQPISDIHLYSDGIFPQLKATGDIRYVWMFGIIGLFMVIIALINFVNLSTARSINRSREVGVRKVLGSERWQLIGQFLMESILLSVCAFVIGYVGVKTPSA